MVVRTRQDLSLWKFLRASTPLSPQKLSLKFAQKNNPSFLWFEGLEGIKIKFIQELNLEGLILCVGGDSRPHTAIALEQAKGERLIDRECGTNS